MTHSWVETNGSNGKTPARVETHRGKRMTGEPNEDGLRLTAARAGDEQAFRALVEPHLRALTGHCYRMLGSSSEAEDAVQDALVRAWRGLAGFEGRASFRSWL